MLRCLSLILLLGAATTIFADEQVRSVTVVGSGTATVAPDKATVSMSIEAREPTLNAAQERAAEVVQRVLKMADRMGISRDRVDTTGASVRPDYRWNRDKEEQELRGYIAARQIAIEIDDLDDLGAVVEGAVSAGVNQVSPPMLGSSERKETYRRALRAAARDAKANAAQLADTLGASLGPVITISSAANAPRPPVPQPVAARMMAAEADAAESYNPADLRFDARVTVVFELED